MAQDGNDYHVRSSNGEEVGTWAGEVHGYLEGHHIRTTGDGGHAPGEVDLRSSGSEVQEALALGRENGEGASPWGAWVHCDHGESVACELDLVVHPEKKEAWNWDRVAEEAHTDLDASRLHEVVDPPLTWGRTEPLDCHPCDQTLEDQ